MSLSKTLSFLIFISFSLFTAASFVSCGGDNPPDPKPIPNVTHTININGTVPGAVYEVFDNGSNIDGDTANSQGDTNLSFINKEKTTVVDSITGEADGYSRWVVKNQSIGTTKSYTPILNEITNKTANATFKVIDNATKKTIENLIVQYNNVNTPIDSTFSISDVPVGAYQLTFKKSDSTWMIIPDITKTANLVEGDNVFTYEVDATKKQFFADLTLNVDDQDDKDLEGAVLSANDKTATTASNGQAKISSVKELPAQSIKPWLAGSASVTYDLTKDGYKDFAAKTVTLNEGDNTYSAKLEKEATASNESGDVRIGTKLKGTIERGTIITLTNTQIPDSTYTINSGDKEYADFMNIFVANNHNPTQYKIEIIDSDADGRFLKTTTFEDIYQDENGEINSTKAINLNEIPNTQNLSAIIRNYKTLNEESGVTVELHNSNTNALINSQTSDATGHVEFTGVPGSTDVYTVVKKAGYYTKTNGKHNIDLVDHISEMNDTINVTAVEHMNNKDGNFISGEIIQRFKPIAYNTEFLLGHLRLYFPEINGGNQIYKDYFTEAATLLEMPGAIIPSDTNFTEPTSGQIGGYNPYPESREVYDGLIGTNILSYSGTSTSTDGKTLSNGTKIIIYGDTNLGGLDKSANHHELGWLLGFPAVNGNTTDFKTSRDTSAPESFEFQEATYDIPVMSTWLKLGKHHFNTTDNQGRMIEYNTTIKFE